MPDYSYVPPDRRDLKRFRRVPAVTWKSRSSSTGITLLDQHDATNVYESGHRPPEEQPLRLSSLADAKYSLPYRANSACYSPGPGREGPARCAKFAPFPQRLHVQAHRRGGPRFEVANCDLKPKRWSADSTPCIHRARGYHARQRSQQRRCGSGKCSGGASRVITPEPGESSRRGPAACRRCSRSRDRSGRCCE